MSALFLYKRRNKYCLNNRVQVPNIVESVNSLKSEFIFDYRLTPRASSSVPEPKIELVQMLNILLGIIGNFYSFTSCVNGTKM